MIRNTPKFDGTGKKLIVSEQKKVIDILREAGIHFSSIDSASIDGKLLSVDDLNRNLPELGYADSSEPTIKILYDLPWETDDSLPETLESMVYPLKAMVIGSACVIFSAFSPNVLQDFQNFLPEAMIMRNTSGEPVFTVSLDVSSPGSLDKSSAVFSRRTANKGKATITIMIDPEVDDPREAIITIFGSAILHLLELEESMKKRIFELEEKKSLLNKYMAII